MIFVTATLLRLNNVGMLQRRAAVTAADKNGNPDDIQARIFDLQRYSAQHMNADTGTFYLQEQYNRDVKTAMKAAGGEEGSSGENSPYARADAVCNPRYPTRGYSKAYQDCILAELGKEGQVVDPASIKLPSPALYRYGFNSPLWSPDFAGFSTLICMLIMLAIVVRLAALGVLHLLLKRTFRGI